MLWKAPIGSFLIRHCFSAIRWKFSGHRQKTRSTKIWLKKARPTGHESETNTAIKAELSADKSEGRRRVG